MSPERDWPEELLPFLVRCPVCHGLGGGTTPDEPWGPSGATPGGYDECPECGDDGRVLRLPPMYGPIQWTPEDLEEDKPCPF